MRDLERNKRRIYYATYRGKIAVQDENGYDTGEYTPSYSAPIPLRVNVSPAYGESANKAFGTTLDYDHTIVTTDLSLPIDEQSVLWIDEKDTSKPFDYTVKKIARSLNSILIAVKKGKVS